MSDPENDKRQRRRMPLLYAVIGACVLITALSINAQAGNLLQLNFGNDTKIYFNDTESQINGTFLVNGSQVCTVASGCSGGGTDLNNYTTATSFTGNVLSTTRNGMSTLTATIPNNAITLACQNITGAASNLCTITGGGSGSGNLTMDSNVSGWPLQASNSTHITNLEVSCDYASGYAIGRLSNNSVCFQTLLPATASATYLTIANAATTYYPLNSNPAGYYNSTTIPADNTTSNLNTNRIPVWNGSQLTNSNIKSDSTSINTTAPIYVVNGSASAPSYSFENDTNTGLYYVAADTFAITAGGTSNTFFTSAYLRGATGDYYSVRFGLRSATSPTYSWRNDEDTGIGSNGANNISFITQGIERARMDESGQLGLGTNDPNATLDIVGTTTITQSANTPALNLSNTNAGRTENLIVTRPGVGGIYISTAGGLPAVAQIGSKDSSSVSYQTMSLGTSNGATIGKGDFAMGNSGSLSAPSLFARYNNTAIGIANSAPNSTLEVSGNASFSGNLATFGGLFNNNSQVCTAANGLCGTGSGGANLVTLNSTNGTDAHNITLTWDNGTTFTTTINDQSGGSGISTFNATNGSTIVNSTTNAVVNITAGNNINVDVNDQGTFNISQLTLPQSVLLFDEWVDPYYGGSIEDGEAGMMGWNVVAGGTGAGASMTSAQREPGRRGIMNLTTGSTNGGNVTVHLSVNMIYFNATSGKLIQFGGFNIGTTSGANNITYLMGFGDQTTSTAAAQNDTDAIWIAYNASGGNNNLSLITRSNSVQSENVTDIQVTAEQFYDYQLIVYNNTRVELYIDEQLKAILNTNIPSGNTRLLGPMQKLRKLGTNTGTTAVMVGVDYYGIRYEFGEKK